MKFLTLPELKVYAEENPIEWAVDELLKEASFNICVGGPKSGKSTLMRQLAVSVSKGEPFLGRATKKGKVLYACPDEQDTTLLHLAFTQIDATDGIYICPFPVERKSLISELRKAISDYPEIRLVVLDTLERSVGIEDFNDYGKMHHDLEELINFATESKLTIIATHHSNKRITSNVVASIMGSNAIAALAVTTIGILEDGADKRFIKTVQRGAPALDRTELVFDKFRRVSLGKSDSEKREQSTNQRKDEIKTSILEFVAANPGTKQSDIIASVTGKAKDIIDKLKELEFSRLLGTSGTGRKGNPKLYYVADLPREKAAA